jgi:hypothetical protein
VKGFSSRFFLKTFTIIFQTAKIVPIIILERGWGIKKRGQKTSKKFIQRRYRNGKKDMLGFTDNVNWH